MGFFRSLVVGAIRMEDRRNNLRPAITPEQQADPEFMRGRAIASIEKHQAEFIRLAQFEIEPLLQQLLSKDRRFLEDGIRSRVYSARNHLQTARRVQSSMETIAKNYKVDISQLIEKNEAFFADAESICNQMSERYSL